MDGFNEFLVSMETFFKSSLEVIVLFIITAIVGFIIIKLLLRLLRKIESKGKIEGTLFKFIYAIAKFLLYMTYILTLLAIAGVPITTIVAVITALALGLTLALQSSVSNISNGAIIMMNKPFVLGDFVEINGKEGTVVDINMFNTKILTVTNEAITIPHNMTISNTIKDYSAMPTRRVDIIVSLDFASDIEKAKTMLFDIIANNEYVIQDEANAVSMASINERSVNLQVKAWCSGKVYWDCLYSLNESIYKLFSEDNIDMPFQKMQVDIKKDDTTSANAVDIKTHDTISANTVDIKKDDTISENAVDIKLHDTISANAVDIKKDDTISENAVDIKKDDTKA